MDDRIPRSYRRLIATYPRRWRQDRGDVVLGTLLDLHADLGRSRPSILERLEFFVSGVIARAPWRTHATALAPSHLLGITADDIRGFDQTNHLDPEPVVDEATQIRRNRSIDRNATIEAVTANAPIGLIIR